MSCENSRELVTVRILCLVSCESSGPDPANLLLSTSLRVNTLRLHCTTRPGAASGSIQAAPLQERQAGA